MSDPTYLPLVAGPRLRPSPFFEATRRYGCKVYSIYDWLSLADSDVLLWVKGVAAFAGMNVNVVEPDVSPLQVHGPESVAVMKWIFGDRVDELRYFRGRRPGEGQEPFRRNREATFLCADTRRPGSARGQ